MPGTEVRTRTVATLGAADIGKAVIVHAPGWMISGRLYEVTFEGEQADVGTGYTEAFRARYTIRRSVQLTIGPWSGEVSPDTAVSTAWVGSRHEPPVP